MKKLLVRLFCLALPFLCYFGAFLYFEPYDYFGLKGGAVSEDSYITRIRSFLNQPQDSIILGDSRMAHFDMDLVEQASGVAWSNLAFGGASMNESLDLFYLAAEKTALKRCVFEVSFYTLREGDARNRMQAITTVVENPFAYLTNFNTNIDMLNEAAQRLRGIQTGATRDAGNWAEEDYLDETGAPLPYRRNLIAYAATLYANVAKPGVVPAIETETITDGTGASAERCTNPTALLKAMQSATESDSAYTVNEENMKRLEELAAYCRENNIELTFVLPPIDDALRELLVEPLGIDSELEQIKSRLEATGVPVLDFEYEPIKTFTQEQYYDGLHLDVVRGLPEYTSFLFQEVMA